MASKAASRKNYEKWIDQVKAGTARARAEMRRKIGEYKVERGCSRCGERHPACLDFHHLDPTTKEFSIGDVLARGWCWARVLPEIEKCDILCANCHRKEHYTRVV